MKHALITGGASGLGLGCAHRFVALGYRVTLADINEESGPGVARRLGAPAHFEALDLSNADSIVALARRLQARGDPIDVLVNNAGIYPPSRRMSTVDGQELCFAIAHLGHFRLTQALWPLLRAAPAARVVSISSLVQRRARLYLDDLALEHNYSPLAAYAQAKLACLLFAIELQRRLDRSGSSVRSYAAHPGVCRTQLGHNRRVAPGDSLLQRASSYALRLLAHVGQTAEQGAEPVVLVATTDQFPPGSFVGPTGFLEAGGKVGLVKPGKAASDPALAAELWQRTEAITGQAWTP